MTADLTPASKALTPAAQALLDDLTVSLSIKVGGSDYASVRDRLLKVQAAARASAEAEIAELRTDAMRWREAESEGHTVDFTEDRYGLQHPPSCRPNLIGCIFNEWLASQPGPDMEPGRYRMTWTDGGPKYDPLLSTLKESE